MKHRLSVPAASAALCGLAALGLAAPAVARPGAHVADDLVTYGVAVPQDARAKVHSVETGDGRTVVTLHVKGMAPSTAYGAHAHTNACGRDGAAAGPHFQHVPDPVAPSTDPAYANAENEVWLDLTTDAAGNGSARAVLSWQFRPGHRAGSVIIHERHTSTGAGEAGTAGARVACLPVPF